MFDDGTRGSLRELKRRLEAGRQRARERLAGAETRLGDYQRVGPEFQRIVHQYHSLLQQVDEVDKDLQLLVG